MRYIIALVECVIECKFPFLQCILACGSSEITHAALHNVSVIPAQTVQNLRIWTSIHTLLNNAWPKSTLKYSMKPHEPVNKRLHILFMMDFHRLFQKSCGIFPFFVYRIIELTFATTTNSLNETNFFSITFYQGFNEKSIGVCLRYTRKA